MSGRSFTPRYGVKATATIHEAIKEKPTIQKIFPAYSPAVERAKPTGKNPITVTIVPASIGAAVTPGISRGLDAVHSLLHLHHHGFDGDDGIVHQKSERDDECSQCNSIKNPIRNHHDHKYRTQG